MQDVQVVYQNPQQLRNEEELVCPMPLRSPYILLGNYLPFDAFLAF